MEEKEIWKPVVGYEGLYSCSSLGRIRREKKTIINSLGRICKYECDIINGCFDRLGYMIVTLTNNHKQKTYKIHRLIAQAFLPNPENLPQVHHKNEIKIDNFVGTPENNFTDGNLEWVTAKQNCNAGTRNKRMSTTKINGKKSKHVYQYTLDMVFVREWPSVREIERQLGFKSSNISTCCRGIQKTAYGYMWEYAA